MTIKNINMSLNSNDIKNVKDSVVKKEEDLKLLSKQKQLIDLGEVIQKRKQIETLRLEKKEKVDEYISQNLNIKIPEDAKNDNYHNMLRNTLDENKDLLEKYKLKNENQLGTFTGVVEKFNEDELKNDLVNLYYGYKLTKLFLKLKEKDLEKSKEIEKEIKVDYDNLVKESCDTEEDLDVANITISNLKKLIVFLTVTFFLTNILLLYYVYQGPEVMHSNINYTIYVIKEQIILLSTLVNVSLDFIFNNLILGIPNVYKLILTFVGYYFFKYINTINEFLIHYVNLYIKNNLYRIKSIIELLNSFFSSMLLAFKDRILRKI